MAEKEELKEQRSHGNILFPLAVYEWEENVPSVASLHWHKEMEILYLEQGKFHFTCDMKKYVVESPAIVFIGAGKLHSIELMPNQKESAIVFDFNMLLFQNNDEVETQVIMPLMEGKLEFPFILKRGDLGFELVNQWYRTCKEEAETGTLAAKMRVKAGLLFMIAELAERKLLIRKYKDEKQDQTLELMKKMIRYIQENYQKKMKLEELAKTAGMNEQYLCRFFKRKTGKTITEYINELRISYAVAQLAETNETVLNIAMDSGYENIGYFMKRFRRVTGMTPLEYRKRIKSK